MDTLETLAFSELVTLKYFLTIFSVYDKFLSVTAKSK